MASLYDSASLVMIPSGYKDDKLYSIKPTDGSGDFTFSRDGAGASPATRVNASGLIEKGRENEILQSNQFNTTWAAILGASVTSGQSGYDGSNDAWTFTKASGQSSRIYQDITLSPIVHTTSIYAKAGTLQYLAILEFSGSFVYFDLQNGTSTTASGSPIDVNIESVGNGWYRCSITDDSNITQLRIYASDTNGSINGAGTIFIQDAQVESGLVATDYIETTTAPVSAGLLGDMPRLDYSGGATCPSLLLEPSRTNLLSHSEYVSAMSLSSVSATANATTSPEGVGNAYEVEPTGTGFKTIGNFISVTPSSKYTISFFYKNVDHKNIGFYDNNTSGSEIQINVQDNTFTLGASCDDGDVENYGNGWYRAWCSFTALNSTLANYLIFRSDSNSGSYTATGSSIYVYGFQIEAGSYPTSYIPTYGTAANRGEDDCVKTGISSLIGQTEGTMFVDIDFTNTSGTQVLFSLHDGAANKRFEIWSNNNVVNGFIGGSVSIAIGNTTISNGRHKIAIAYDESGDQAFYVDGVQIGTSATPYTITSITTASFQQYGGLLNPTEGVNQVLLFKTRLTNAELAALTTI